MHHIPLKVLAAIHKAGMLGDLDATVEKMCKVEAIQNCYACACALSKWHRLSENPKAGPHIFLHWGRLQYGLSRTLCRYCIRWIRRGKSRL